jgi:cytochrome c-type biogenesis protein CcmH/NrfG
MEAVARREKPASRSVPGKAAALLLLLAFVTVASLRLSAWRAERDLQTASLARLQAVSQADPYNPRVFYFLGVRYREGGRLREACAAFRDAAARDTDDETYFLAWAAAACARNTDAEAFGVLTAYLKQHPDSARVHRAVAELFLKRRAYRKAYDEALAAARLEPRDEATWLLAGTAALDGDYRFEAEGALRQAIALDPNDFRGHLHLGNTLFDLSRYHEAVARYREAVRLAPQDATTHLALARALLSRAASPEDYEAVRQNLRRSLALRPDIPYASLFLGRSYARQARWREALPPLERAARLAPNSAETQFELSRVYRRLGEAAKADAAARRQRQLIAAEHDVRNESAFKQSHESRVHLSDAAAGIAPTNAP